MDFKRKNELQDTMTSFYKKPIAKVSIELFLSIGAVIFFALFAIRPTLLTMSDLIKEIEDKRELNEMLGNKIASLATAQTTYMAMEDKVQLLDQAMPNNENIVKTLKLIEKIASEQNIAITQMSVSKVPEVSSEESIVPAKKTLDQVSISVGVVGDYQSIRQFVEGLRLSRRSLIVETVTFKVEGFRGNKTLKANITIVAPYYGE